MKFDFHFSHSCYNCFHFGSTSSSPRKVFFQLSFEEERLLREKFAFILFFCHNLKKGKIQHLHQAVTSRGELSELFSKFQRS